MFLSKNWFALFVASVFLVSEVACADVQTSVNTENNQVGSQVKDISRLQGEWNIAHVGQENFLKVESPIKPFIGFDTKEGRIYGKSSCNSFMGAYSFDVQKGILTLPQVATTRMMCSPENMQKEQIMLKALEQVRGFSVEGDSAYLLDQNNTVLIEMTKKSK